MLKSIKIFDSVYTIDWVKDETGVNPQNSEELALGWVDYFGKKIRIFDSASSSERGKALLHEILHILTRELRIIEIQKHPRVEEIIDLLAMGLITIITDNNLLGELDGKD